MDRNKSIFLFFVVFIINVCVFDVLCVNLKIVYYLIVDFFKILK